MTNLHNKELFYFPSPAFAETICPQAVFILGVQNAVVRIPVRNRGGGFIQSAYSYLPKGEHASLPNNQLRFYYSHPIFASHPATESFVSRPFKSLPSFHWMWGYAL